MSYPTGFDQLTDFLNEPLPDLPDFPFPSPDTSYLNFTPGPQGTPSLSEAGSSQSFQSNVQETPLEQRLARLEAQMEQLVSLQQQGRPQSSDSKLDFPGSISMSQLEIPSDNPENSTPSRLNAIEWQLAGLAQAWAKEDKERASTCHWGKRVDQQLKALTETLADRLRSSSTATLPDFPM